MEENDSQSSETQTGQQHPNFTESVPNAEEGPIMRDYFKDGIDEDERGRTVIGRTPSGKTVQVMKRLEGIGYVVNFQEGGETPEMWGGIWTNYHLAEEIARRYLTERWLDNAEKATDTAGK